MELILSSIKLILKLLFIQLVLRIDSPLIVQGLMPRVPISFLRFDQNFNSTSRNSNTTSYLSKNEDNLIQQFEMPGDRIVGGKPAPFGDFPYQASLQKISFFGKKTHYCGASIISPHCLITAAQRNSRDILARVGSISLRPDPQGIETEVEKYVIYPEYDSNTIQHDIGIIKLKSGLSFRPNLNQVPLPEFKSEVPLETECQISGFGSTNEGSPVSKTLMYAQVPIISDDACRESYGKSEIFETMTCAGYDEGAIDSCQGDSGGPLVCNGKLTGIVSWGIGCARPKFPGVYTQVSHYTKWIKSQKFCFPARDDKLDQPTPVAEQNHKKNFTFSLFPNFWVKNLNLNLNQYNQR